MMEYLLSRKWIEQADLTGCVHTHVSGPQRGKGKEKGPSETDRSRRTRVDRSEWRQGEWKKASFRGSLETGSGPWASGGRWTALPRNVA